MNELDEIINFLSHEQRNAVCDNLKALSTFIKGLTYESGMSDEVALAVAINCMYEHSYFSIHEFKNHIKSDDC